MCDINKEIIEYFNKEIEKKKEVINLPICDKGVAEVKQKHIVYYNKAISDIQKLENVIAKIVECDCYKYCVCIDKLNAIEEAIKDFE